MNSSKTNTLLLVVICCLLGLLVLQGFGYFSTTSNVKIVAIQKPPDKQPWDNIDVEVMSNIFSSPLKVKIVDGKEIPVLGN